MRDAANPASHPALDEEADELGRRLRSRFAEIDRAALKALPVIEAYSAYFKRFKKSYPVLLQLESVVLRGGSIPRSEALVEAMFMAELKNLLLTAGHDLDAIQPPVRLDVSDGSERYTLLNGREQLPAPGDMFMADAQGVISSVVYGPDSRTRLTADTRNVLFAVYAVPGVGEQTVRQHLEDLRENVRLVAPEAEVEWLEVCHAE